MTTQLHAGVIAIDALGATVTGMPDPVDFCAVIERLYADEEQAHWSIPDLLLWSESVGDERYAQALDPTKQHPGTLANRKSICRKFPKDKRRWALSQRHYAQLTSLMPDNEALAFELLALAVNTGMTSEELRTAKKERLHEPVPETFATTLVYCDGVFVSQIAPPAWITEGETFDIVLKEKAAA